MDVYVYVDGVPLIGDDADIRLELPLSDISIHCEEGERLDVIDPNGNQRLNIYVSEGFNNGVFSNEIKDQIRIYYNIYHNGEGEIHLVNNGEISTITNLILQW